MSEWQPIDSAPRDGSQFLALASNGWYDLVRAPAEAIREGWPYQWWIAQGRASYPVVESHDPGTDWSQHSTLLLTYWMLLPSPPETARTEVSEP
jgi:hypothetical protein